MTLPHVLKRIRLNLARSKEFPSGSTKHGYEFVAPLDSKGHIDPHLPANSGRPWVPPILDWASVPSFSGLLAMPSNAQEIGHSGAGLAEARRLCSQCHAVEKAETPSPRTDAPAFQDIAGTSGMTATALSAALNTSHQSMPNIMLESDEKADIVAYILSLK